MKRSMISSVLLGLTLLLATHAFAVNKGSMQVQERVVAEGQAIPAGQYKVKWDGDGPNVELNILKFNKAVATVRAHVVELQRSDSADSTVTRKNDDGSTSLLEIHFRGKKHAFALENPEVGMKSGQSTNN